MAGTEFACVRSTRRSPRPLLLCTQGVDVNPLCAIFKRQHSSRSVVIFADSRYSWQFCCYCNDCVVIVTILLLF